jgi:hypothetical protein
VIARAEDVSKIASLLNPDFIHIMNAKLRFQFIKSCKVQIVFIKRERHLHIKPILLLHQFKKKQEDRINYLITL